jgi:hypothetical protein
MVGRVSLPRLLLRAEGVAILAASLTLYVHLGLGWVLFIVLLLTPDLALAGYLYSVRAGVIAYDVTHTELWSVALGTAGVLTGEPRLYQLALIWLVHIGIDRTLGFGLKDPAWRFWETHLQRV